MKDPSPLVSALEAIADADTAKCDVGRFGGPSHYEFMCWEGDIRKAAREALAAYRSQPDAPGAEPTLWTDDDVRADLQKWVKVAGSISGVARDIEVHDQQLRLFLTGKRPLEPALATALGLERVVFHRRVAAWEADAQLLYRLASALAEPSPSAIREAFLAGFAEGAYWVDDHIEPWEFKTASTLQADAYVAQRQREQGGK